VAVVGARFGLGFATRAGFDLAATRLAVARFGARLFAAAFFFGAAALGVEKVFGCAGSAAVVPAAPGRLAPPVRRFSLRCPGRDLGRLPSTPCSSLLSAATPQK
jgi:hypothetical protein